MKKQHFSLDDTLLSFHDGLGVTYLSTAQLMTNVLIAGTTGSGKTSSSGATIAINSLRKGYGFLVFCVKETEAKRFIQYARNAGRENDIVHVRPGGKQYFDFLRYESQPRYNGKSITSNSHSTYDLTKFTLYSGDINPRFFKFDFFGHATVRQVETIYEPLFAFLIGLVLKLGGQPIGMLLMISAVFYSLSYRAEGYRFEANAGFD